MKAAFDDTVRTVTDALDSILAFEEVCDRGSDSGGWQSEELEAAFKKVVAARASLPALSQQWQPVETAPRDDLVLLGRLEDGILAWAQPGYWADGWALPFDSERDESGTPFLGDEEQPTHWLCRIPK